MIAYIIFRSQGGAWNLSPPGHILSVHQSKEVAFKKVCFRELAPLLDKYDPDPAWADHVDHIQTFMQREQYEKAVDYWNRYMAGWLCGLYFNVLALPMEA
jgi:hypothetical protein